MFNIPIPNISAISSSILLIASIKILFLVLVGFLVIFLFVVLRQVASMNKIVNDTNDSIVLRLISTALFLISVSLFIAAFVIL